MLSSITYLFVLNWNIVLNKQSVWTQRLHPMLNYIFTSIVLADYVQTHAEKYDAKNEALNMISASTFSWRIK